MTVTYCATTPARWLTAHKDRVNISIGDRCDGWWDVQVPGGAPYWAILLLHVSQDVWFVNSKELKRADLPPAHEGTVSVYSEYNLPGHAASARAVKVAPPALDLLWAFGEKYQHHDFSLDWVLAGLPNTVVMAKEDYTYWPEDHEYPSVALYLGGRLVRSAQPLSRAIMTRPSKEAPTIRASVPRGLADSLSAASGAVITELAHPWIRPVEERRSRVLVVALGSHGDIAPANWLARLIAHAGNEVDLWVAGNTTAADFHAMRHGDYTSQLTGFLSSLQADQVGYAKVCGPQLLSAPFAFTYSLLDWEVLDAPAVCPGSITAWFHKIMPTLTKPFLVLGNTAGCNVPGSNDGVHPRLPMANKCKERRVGWVGGSYGSRIPLDVTNRVEEIKLPYTADIFSQFTEVHTAGSIGTVTAIIQHGAEPITWDASLYQTWRTKQHPGSFTVPDLDWLHAVLRLQGLHSPLSWWGAVKTYPQLGFQLMKDRMNIQHLCAVILIASNFGRLSTLSLALFLSVPRIVRIKTPIEQQLGIFLKLSFQFPILPVAFGSWWLGFCIVVNNLITQWVLFSAAKRAGVVCRVHIDGVFPFVRHAAVWDTVRNEGVEGEFGESRNFLAPFKWKRYGPGEGAPWTIEIPLPVDIRRLEQLTLMPGAPYRAWHNCQSMILRECPVYLPVLVVLGLTQGILLPFILVCQLFLYVAYKGGWDLYATKPDKVCIWGRERQDDDPLPLEPSTVEWETPDVTSEVSTSVDTSSELVAVWDTTLYEPNHRTAEDLVLRVIDDLESDDIKVDDSELLEAVLSAARDEVESTATDEQRVLESWEPDPQDTFLLWVQDMGKYLLVEAKQYLSSIPQLQDLLYWLEAAIKNMKVVLETPLGILTGLLQAGVDMTKSCLLHLAQLTTRLMRFVFGDKITRRAKAAWTMNGVVEAPSASLQRRLRESLAKATLVCETDLDAELATQRAALIDCFRWGEENKEAMARLNIQRTSLRSMFGAYNKHRPLRMPSGPVMSQQEFAILLGECQKEGKTFDARIDEYFTLRNERMQALGTLQAIDGAAIGAIRPEQTTNSIVRYVTHGLDPEDPDAWLDPKIYEAIRKDWVAGKAVDPQYEAVATRWGLTAEMRELWTRAADAVYKAMPDMVDNPKLSAPEQVLRHWQMKGKMSYNPDVIMNAKTRSHALIKGMYAAAIRNVKQDLAAGVYRPHLYSCFNKRQPVAAKKIITPDEEGRYKPVRTVVGQNFVPLAIDEVVSHEMKNRHPQPHWNSVSHLPAGQCYSEFFRRKKGFGYVIEGDASQMDASIEAGAFYALDRLMERGCSIPEVNSITKAKHAAMTNSYICVLSQPEGIPLPEYLAKAQASNNKGYEHWVCKLVGGATGESSTHWTDDAVMKISQCAIFSEYARRKQLDLGCEPEDYFFKLEVSDFTNSADDNMWGITFPKGHLYDPVCWADCARKFNFKMEMIVRKDWTQLEFLSCRGRDPTNRDTSTLRRMRQIYDEFSSGGHRDLKDIAKYVKMNPKVVDPMTRGDIEVVVYRNMTNARIRETAATMGAPMLFKDQEWLARDIMKLGGHAALCGFDPVTHVDITHSWIQSAARYLYAAMPGHHCNQHGLVAMPEGEALEFIMKHLEVTEQHCGRRGRTLRVQVRAKSLDPKAPELLKRRLLWLSQRPIPHYLKVMSIHMGAVPKDDSFYERLHAKLSRARPDEVVKELLDTGSEIVRTLGKKIYKGLADRPADMDYLEPILRSRKFWVEKAMWTARIDKMKKAGVQDPEISLPEWQQLCSRASFGSLTDPLTFYTRMVNDQEFEKETFSHPAYVYQNMMAILMLSYVGLWYAERAISRLFIIGTLYTWFMFMVIDMSKVYSIGSAMYWLATLETSPYLSSWMPRDPYILAKRASLWVLEFFPVHIGYVIRCDMLIATVGALFEALAIVYNRMQTLKPESAAQHVQNPWVPEAEELLGILKSEEKVTLKSGTGTGKSSLGVAAVAGCMMRDPVYAGGKVILLVPTRILLKDPFPAFLKLGLDTDEARSRSYQVLRRGVIMDPSKSIYLATYGHALERLRGDDFNPQKDVVFSDEMHLASPEQRLFTHQWKGKMIMSSATPAPLPGVMAPVHVTRQKKKWIAHRRIFPDSTPIASMYQRAWNDHTPVCGMVESPHELAKRSLILCSTFKQLDMVREALRELTKSVVGGPIGISMPPVFEVSSRVKEGTPEWTWRNECLQGPEWIALGTKQAATGWDAKPNPPRLLVDGGIDIEEHMGDIIECPTDMVALEQAEGRVTRNSATGPGLVYARECAGSRDFKIVNYPATNRLSEELIAEQYSLPQLRQLQAETSMSNGEVISPYSMAWPYFAVRRSVCTEEHTYQAVAFATLAMAAGVGERDLRVFYKRHWQDRIPLPDDYEWLERVMGLRTIARMREAPAWAFIHTMLGRDPVIWNVDQGAVAGGGRIDGFSCAGPLRPRQGQLWTYDALTLTKFKPVQVHSLKNEEVGWLEDTLASTHAQLLKAESDLRRLGHFVPSEELGETKPRKDWNALERERLRHYATEYLMYKTDRQPRNCMLPKTSDKVDPDEGTVVCRQCGIVVFVGDSGPHIGACPSFPCGHALASGDHIISPNALVLSRGSKWTARFAPSTDEADDLLEGLMVLARSDDCKSQWRKTSNAVRGFCRLVPEEYLREPPLRLPKGIGMWADDEGANEGANRQKPFMTKGKRAQQPSGHKDPTPKGVHATPKQTLTFTVHDEAVVDNKGSQDLLPPPQRTSPRQRGSARGRRGRGTATKPSGE